MQAIIPLIAVAAALLLGPAEATPKSDYGRGLDLQPFVAGGLERENGDLKFMVEIVETPKGLQIPKTHSGSGILLAKDWVLTTAYTVSSSVSLLTKFRVVVGRSKGGDGTVIDIDKQVAEPTEKTLTLLKLASSVTFDATIRPVNLPFPNSQTSGVKAMVAGWGATKDGSQKTLLAATVKVLSSDECRALGVKNPEGKLCSNDAQIGACKGDDGSPLVQDLKNGVYKLLGVATDTKGVACPPKGPTVYVDVAKHAQWLLDSTI